MAMLYDLILLFGVVFIAFLPAPAIPRAFMESTAGKFLSQGYLVLIVFGFFGWFWTHRGQTLGMRAWRIRVVANDGRRVTWWLAARRFVFACLSLGMFGIGLFWCLVHPSNMTWHDLWSGTRLVMVSKPGGS